MVCHVRHVPEVGYVSFLEVKIERYEIRDELDYSWLVLGRDDRKGSVWINYFLFSTHPYIKELKKLYVILWTNVSIRSASYATYNVTNVLYGMKHNGKNWNYVQRRAPLEQAWHQLQPVEDTKSGERHV